MYIFNIYDMTDVYTPRVKERV